MFSPQTTRRAIIYLSNPRITNMPHSVYDSGKK
jgi:hypothetical protein